MSLLAMPNLPLSFSYLIEIAELYENKVIRISDLSHFFFEKKKIIKVHLDSVKREYFE